MYLIYFRPDKKLHYFWTLTKNETEIYGGKNNFPCQYFLTHFFFIKHEDLSIPNQTKLFLQNHCFHALSSW